MTNILYPTVFESFNARNLRPAQVAKTFVPSEHFKNISKRTNSLVIGPRGSGKTTLFKMLESEALEHWDNVEADKYRSSIDFIGVFIPTDRIWKEQIDYLTKKNFSAEDAEFFSKALFCSHVLYKVIQAIQYRCVSNIEEKEKGYKKILLSKDSEKELVLALSELWHIDITVPSIKSLMSALLIRKSEIPRIIEEEKTLGVGGRKSRLAEKKFLSLSFLQATSVGLELLSIYTENIAQEKWALMFDELELAPTCVVQELINALRGADDRLLFKLSLAPYNPDINIVSDLMSAMPGNDYEFVILWYATKSNEARSFCEKMLIEMLKEKEIFEKTPEDIFGKSDLDGHQDIIENMIIKDESFKTFLIDKKLLVGGKINLSELSVNDKDSIIRKAIPILRVRNEFLKHNSTRRSRKTITPVYSGANALFDMLEANPRWFIGVINPLLDEYKETRKPIAVDKQLNAIKKAIHKFRSLLKTIPCPAKVIGTEDIGVDKLIDKIGNHFSDCVLGRKFSLDPPGSFIVPKGFSPGLHKSLGAALNAGAIVYVNGPSAEVVLENLTDRRFRLSYLLAPHYHLPLQLFYATSLTDIFKVEDTKNLSLLEDFT